MGEFRRRRFIRPMSAQIARVERFAASLAEPKPVATEDATLFIARMSGKAIAAILAVGFKDRLQAYTSRPLKNPGTDRTDLMGRR